MQHRWLTLLSIAVITIIVFVFFLIRLQPIEVQQTAEDGIIPGSITEPTITFVNPVRGAPRPVVTIIEYGDFQCPHCKSVASSMETVLRLFPNQVKHVWKDLPNESAHPFAIPAAIAAHCADKQGAFWDYHDLLFDRQAFLTDGQFTQIATELGLDLEAFQSCTDSQETLPIIRRDYEEGLALGLTATPTLLINNERYVGAITTEQLILYVQQAIDNR